MSDDGADLNMPAEGALHAVMGGDQPERMTDEAFEAMIRVAEAQGDYGDTANYAARVVLEFLEAHPEHRDAPMEDEWHFEIDGHRPDDEQEGWRTWGEPRTKRVVDRAGLYDVMKDAGVDLAALGLTGFMWGWAVNAARKVLGLGSQPNPAIVEIG